MRRISLVLQGLTYQKSGAVAAAATSLPEEVCGSLNWDYRFAWLRDVSPTMQALWVGAWPHEAGRFFEWLAGAIGELGDKPLQIVYGSPANATSPNTSWNTSAGGTTADRSESATTPGSNGSSTCSARCCSRRGFCASR